MATNKKKTNQKPIQKAASTNIVSEKQPIAVQESASASPTVIEPKVSMDEHVSVPVDAASPANPGPAQTQPERKFNVLAILSMVFAILLPLVGIIMGIIALVQIGKSGERGKGLSIAAIVIGSILFVITLVVLLLIAISFMAASSYVY